MAGYPNSGRRKDLSRCCDDAFENLNLAHGRTNFSRECLTCPSNSLVCAIVTPKTETSCGESKDELAPVGVFQNVTENDLK